MNPTQQPNLIDVNDFTTYAPDVDLSAYPNTTATLSGVISMASQQIVNYCAVKGFDYKLETNEVDKAALSPMGDLQLDFRRRPVGTNVNQSGVVTVQLVKGGFTTTLSLADSSGNPLYQIPYPNNRFIFPSSYLAAAGTLILGGSTQLVTMRGADVYTQITYFGGYQNGYPADLKMACVLWVRSLLAWPYNNTGATSFTQGSLSTSWGADADDRFLKQAKRTLNQGGYVRVASQF